MKLGVRDTQKAITKERITIRLTREAVERFQATGEVLGLKLLESVRQMQAKNFGRVFQRPQPSPKTYDQT